MKASLVLFLLLLISCSRDNSKNAASFCSEDSDCPEGYICWEEGCASSTEFAVRVHPHREDFTIQDFNPVNVTSRRIDVTLSLPSILQGSLALLTQDNASQEYTKGFQLESYGKSSSIPGLALPFPIFFKSENNSAKYSLTAPAGEWDIFVYSNDESIPPLHKSIKLGHAQNLDPDLALNSKAVSLDATLTHNSNDSYFYRCQILEANSSKPLSHQITVATNKNFSIKYAHSNSQVILRVVPDPNRNKAYPVLPAQDFASEDNGKFAFSIFDMNDAAPQTVSGVVLTPDGNPLAEAEIRWVGKTLFGKTCSTSVRTNSNGQFATSLIPSQQGTKYQLTVIPPSDSACATTRLDLPVSGESSQIEPIRCLAKSSLRGVIRNSNNEPVPGIAVRIEPYNAAENSGNSAVSNLNTDANGSYFSLLEPGFYRLVAMPPFARKLPWGAKIVQVPQTTNAVADITLSLGHRIAGRVHYPDNENAKQLAGATVAIYTINAANSPTKVYEVLTDKKGEFEAILPWSQEDSKEENE